LKFKSDSYSTYSFYTEKQRIPVYYTGENESNLSPINDNNTLPPNITTNIINNPTPGKIFLSTFPSSEKYLTIAQNDGSIVYSKYLDTEAYDFKKQSDGTLTYYTISGGHFFQMDKDYNIIDTFICGN